MIYVTALLGTLIAELSRYNANQKKYPNLGVWVKDRWDNVAIAFMGAAALCLAYEEVAAPISALINFDITNSPNISGLIIGLGSTPIINFIYKKIRRETTEKKSV